MAVTLETAMASKKMNALHVILCWNKYATCGTHCRSSCQLVRRKCLSQQPDNVHVCRWTAVRHCRRNGGCFSQVRLFSTPVTSQSPKPSKTKPPWRILFFGTDNFSLHTLKVLHANRSPGTGGLVDTLEVVTKQKCPVRKYAEVNGLVTHDWPISISPEKFDVGVIVSFGKLIPNKVIKMFPYGILNIHPSLLPRWRGAAPIPHTVLHGDTVTGVSIMQIRPTRFDQGPILRQTRVPVPSRCTSLQLADILADKGSNMIVDVLGDLVTYLKRGAPQATQGATLAGKLSRSMAYVNWEHQTCQQIDQQYRALHELLPLRTEWQGRSVKLLNMVQPDDNVEKSAQMNLKTSQFSPGQPFYRKRTNTLYVRCKDGWVGFQNVVLKKPMTAQDFDCGYLSKTSFPTEFQFTSGQNGLFGKNN